MAQASDQTQNLFDIHKNMNLIHNLIQFTKNYGQQPPQPPTHPTPNAKIVINIGEQPLEIGYTYDKSPLLYDIPKVIK